MRQSAQIDGGYLTSALTLEWSRQWPCEEVPEKLQIVLNMPDRHWPFKRRTVGQRHYSYRRGHTF
jgi:hypothetical protein